MGGSSSPQQSSQTSNSNSTSGPNPVIAPRLGQLTDQLWSWYGANPAAPAYYPDGTVAAQSGQTQAANQALYNRGLTGLGSGIDTASRGQIADTLGGKYLDVGSNPYFQKALSASFQPGVENLTNQILPGIDSKFAGSGRTGSGSHFDTNMRAVKDLEQTQSNAAATAAQGQYDAERGRQYQALNYLPTMQGMDYQNLTAQAQAGANTDAYAQRKLDDSNAKYKYDQTAQADWYTQMAQRMLGMYPGGSTSGNSYSTGMSTPASNGTASALGTGMGLAGLALQAAPLFGFSDERLKDVHARVGMTDDGLPLYLYNYKGDSRPHIGPMAQEVAQVKPDAVHQHESGYLMVDYNKAMPKGGLL